MQREDFYIQISNQHEYSQQYYSYGNPTKFKIDLADRKELSGYSGDWEVGIQSIICDLDLSYNLNHYERSIYIFKEDKDQEDRQICYINDMNLKSIADLVKSINKAMETLPASFQRTFRLGYLEERDVLTVSVERNCRVILPSVIRRALNTSNTILTASETVNRTNKTSLTPIFNILLPNLVTTLDFNGGQKPSLGTLIVPLEKTIIPFNREYSLIHYRQLIVDSLKEIDIMFEQFGSGFPVKAKSGYITMCLHFRKRNCQCW